jgi:serine/threonine protein kinase
VLGHATAALRPTAVLCCSLLHSCTAVQVIYHVALRLKALHEAGFAHRDVKPSNVMWLPRKNRWTVIDFGCAGKIGERAGLAFSLAYAAPEVVDAFRGRKKSMVVHGAMDAWSLGVVAFELLTGQDAFPPHAGHDEVRAATRTFHGSTIAVPHHFILCRTASWHHGTMCR